MLAVTKTQTPEIVKAAAELGLLLFGENKVQELKSKYKALQRIGNLDTADLSVYVADTEAEWKKHYVEYLQLMDEPNNLGAQSCWILQPHLHQIQALIKKDGAGASVTVDYQTKKYADALRDRPPAKPVLQAP